MRRANDDGGDDDNYGGMEGQSREAHSENDSATCVFTRQGQVLRYGECLEADFSKSNQVWSGAKDAQMVTWE